MGQPVVACSSCYRMNFFTTNCVCSSPVIEPGQALQMCGTMICRPFMDVIILGEPIPALVNTSIIKTKIDLQVAKHIISLFYEDSNSIPNELDVPFKIGVKTFYLKCNVGSFDESDVHIHLGMDFLSLQKFRMKSGNVTLYGHSRWTTHTPDEVQFAYNKPYGNYLRKNLEKLDHSMLPRYSRPALPDTHYRKYFSRFRDHPRT